MNTLLGPNYLSGNDPTSLLHTETVRLPPGESPPARYDQWFAGLAQTAPVCRVHPHTRLVTRPPKRPPKPYVPLSKVSFRSPPLPEPDTYEFSAHLECPACYCSLAKCPPEFLATSFATFPRDTPARQEALARLQDFAKLLRQERAGFALLAGLPGTGKTGLACNLIGAFRDPGSLYLPQSRIVECLRQLYGSRPIEVDDEHKLHSYADLAEYFQHRRLLVLDELGACPLAADELPFLDALLKHRYDHRLPTVLISNLPLSNSVGGNLGVKQYLGDALWDRLLAASEGGRFIIQFTGDSLRRRPSFDYPSASRH